MNLKILRIKDIAQILDVSTRSAQEHMKDLKHHYPNAPVITHEHLHRYISNFEVEN